MTSHDEIRDAIEAWGLTLEMGTHGMGWPQITTLGRILEEAEGAAIRPAPGPRVPRFSLDWRYWVVSRALKHPELHPDCRVIAYIEAGLANGRIHPKAGVSQRARAIEMKPWTYRRRLKSLKECVGGELDRMADRWAMRAYG